jgi:rhodanese-related sulfurtransferase
MKPAGKQKMTWLGLIVALFFLPVLIASCDHNTPPAATMVSPTGGVQTISASQAKALIAQNAGNPNFVIIDVRSPEEYAQGHLDGAINMDLNSPDFRDRVSRLDRSKTYLLYCRTGHRSQAAAAIMREFSFTNLYNLGDGITGWTASGLPLAH